MISFTFRSSEKVTLFWTADVFHTGSPTQRRCFLFRVGVSVTVEDYFLLILGAQRPLAALAAPQKPFKSLGWMLGSISVEDAAAQLHQGHAKNRHMTSRTRPLTPPPPPITTAGAAAASSLPSFTCIHFILHYFAPPPHCTSSQEVI